MSNWLELLKQAVDSDQRGAAGVADVLDVSRTTVSLVVNNKYPAKTDKIAVKVLATYARVQCPHLGESIPVIVCCSHATRPAPTSSAREARHWRACQGCLLRPAKTDEVSHAPV